MDLIGTLVRIVKAPHRKELEGQHGYVRRIVGDPESGLALVYVVEPLSNRKRPVGCLEIELDNGDVITAIGDLVRYVA